MNGGTVFVSYSELDAYRQCPLKWALGYSQLWTRVPGEGSPLARGGLWHRVMQTHYEAIRAGRTAPDGHWVEHPSAATGQRILEQAAQAASLLLVDQATGEQTEDQVLLSWMYQGYLDRYGLDEPWEVVAVERAGQTRLRTPRGGASRFVLKYKMDLVVRDHDTSGAPFKIVDHKSTADFSREKEIDLDDQFGLYTWAFERETGVRAHAVVRSDARTRRNKAPMSLADRFNRVSTHRSERELANIALDAYHTARAAYGAQREQLVHSSPAPDRCTWRCDFLEAHLALRKGIAATPVVLRDFGFYQREAKHQEYTKQEGQG
jgi:hypothetical protein